jgi:hypothetical protein
MRIDGSDCGRPGTGLNSSRLIAPPTLFSHRAGSATTTISYATPVARIPPEEEVDEKKLHDSSSKARRNPQVSIKTGVLIYHFLNLPAKIRFYMQTYGILGVYFFFGHGQACLVLK